MKLNIDKQDLNKLSQLSVGFDVEEYENGTGRVTISFSVLSNNTKDSYILGTRTIDVPVILYPKE